MADKKQAGDVPCPCGDEAHKNLVDWYEDYLGSSAEETLLLKDEFNKAALEEKIEDLSSRITVSDGYCPSCQKLLDEWPDIIKKVPESVPDKFTEPYQQPHFKSTLELETGHRKGCLLCTLFVQCSINRGYQLENWHKKENRLNCLGKSTSILVSVFYEEGYVNLTLTWPGLDNFCWLPADPLYCIKNYEQQNFNLGKQATRFIEQGEVSQLELAKKWLDRCLETHDYCKSTQDCELPTRLIDVDSTPICLVQSASLTTKPRYATLSHCWGTQQFHRLKQDNLEDSKKAIPEEKLTKTFQDAIHITRSLGLQYLWIDSLCIIQKCDIDWRSESALMSSIYNGSTITIAATGAMDGTKGCFLKSPHFISKAHVELANGEVWDIAPSQFYHSVIKSPLAGRAWALQERLLSPRIIHFSKTGLFWECQQCEASESFPEGSPAFEQQHTFHRGREPISEIWHTIVKLYTGAKLTFASDKMVAISGIAQMAFKQNGDQYLAGLWRKDIELQLLWCQVSPGRRLPPGSEYRAPSWSWASVDEKGYVYYDPRLKVLEYVYYAHVLNANVLPVGKDSFGELKGGELRMSYSVMLVGHLIKIPKGQDDTVWTYYEIELASPDNTKEAFRVYPDCHRLDGQDIYLLPVLETLGNDKHNKRGLNGLMLFPTGRKKGEYFRAGFFRLSAFNEDHRKTQDRFLALLEASGKATAEAQSAEILEEPEFADERYVLTII